jgi:hypothetical protein
MKALPSGTLLAQSRVTLGSSAAAGVFALTVVLIVSLLERRQDPELAADRALTGIVFGISIPLLAYAVVDRVSRRGRLDAAVVPVTRYGANRRGAILGILVWCALVTGVLSTVLAVTAVLASRGLHDPALPADVMASAWIAFFGAAAYVGWFAVASVIGNGARARLWALIIDWLLGSGPTAFALFWPRGHVRNLLGAEPVLQMPQWSAGVSLFLLTGAYLGLTLARCRT